MGYDINEDIHIGDTGLVDWGKAVAHAVNDLDERVAPSAHEQDVTGAVTITVVDGGLYELTATGSTTVTLSGVPGCQIGVKWLGDTGNLQGAVMTTGSEVIAALWPSGWTIYPLDALGRKMTPMSTTVHPTATIKATANATGDFPGSPGTVPWTDPRITFLAGTPQAETAGGCSVRPTGGTNVQSNHFAFWVTDTKFAVMVNAWAASDISIWVDGQPVGSPDPFVVPVGQQFVVVKGLTGATHKVMVVLGWGAQLVQLVTSAISTPVSAAPAPPFRIALTGDSYVDSGLAPYFGGAGRELARLTGWAVSPMGQGSTGYTNDGSSSGDASKSVFGSTARIAAIKAANPDLVVVVGSVNDGAASASTVRAAAAAFYSSLDPIPVIVLGVEPLYAASEPAYAAWDVTNSAIISAAQAAPNVIGVIDWRSEDWLTGTGSVSSPKGDGNQDQYIGTADGADTIHPNLAGQKYLWGRAVERIKTFLLTAPSTVPLDSPEFTGTPKAPTAAPGTSTTQLATTAFVAAAVGESGGGGGELSGTGSPEGAVVASVGTYYTDATGAYGAWRWLKASGTGASGWIVVVGDTGWWDVTSLIPADVAAKVVTSDSAVHRRRVNGEVFYRLRIAMTEPVHWANFSSTDQPGWRQPLFMGPGGDSSLASRTFSGNNTSPGFERSPWSQVVRWGGGMYPYDPPVGTGVRAEGSYLADSAAPWPTSTYGTLV